MDFYSYIKVDQNSRKPKYLQIVDAVIYNISHANFKIGDKMPSINGLSEKFNLSRDTIEKAYKILKQRKIITAVGGKGHYIARTELISKVNILFLVNKLSSYKLQVYNSFIDRMGVNSHTNLQIYGCNESLFLNLLEKYESEYDYYVVMLHFKNEKFKYVSAPPKVLEAIKKIPSEKLILVDNFVNLGKEKQQEAIAVYQDFENDIYDALKKGFKKITKYKKMVLIYPLISAYPYPKRLLRGFRKFCIEKSIEFEIINEIYGDIILEKGDLFITIVEDDLVKLIKQIKQNKLKLGKDIGIISYNETPLKDLLDITVVSTDFKIMGTTAAEMILNKTKQQVKIPFKFIDRKSL